MKLSEDEITEKYGKKIRTIKSEYSLTIRNRNGFVFHVDIT